MEPPLSGTISSAAWSRMVVDSSRPAPMDGELVWIESAEDQSALLFRVSRVTRHTSAARWHCQGRPLGRARRQPNGCWQFDVPGRLPTPGDGLYSFAARGKPEEWALALPLGEGVELGLLRQAARIHHNLAVFLRPQDFVRNVGILGSACSGKSGVVAGLMQSIVEANRREAVANDPVPSRPGAVSLFVSDRHGQWSDLAFQEGVLRLNANARALRGESSLRLRLDRRDLVPQDLASIGRLPDSLRGAAEAVFDEHGDGWISAILSGIVDPDDRVLTTADLAALNHQLAFLAGGRSALVTRAEHYDSCLPDLLFQLHRGLVVIAESSDLKPLEERLLVAAVTRTTMDLRRALSSAADWSDLVGTADDVGGLEARIRSKHLRQALLPLLGDSPSPFRNRDGSLAPLERLPVVSIMVHQQHLQSAGAVCNDSTYAEALQNGRRCNLGLMVVSDTARLPAVVATELLVLVVLAHRSRHQRLTLRKMSQVELGTFSSELRILKPGQAILAAADRQVALPIQVR